MPTCLVCVSFPETQHIITQDFARNQDPPVSSSAPTTFQSSIPPVSSSGRVKAQSRYSPENQPPHHQRPSSRVSPENAPDKSRARYAEQKRRTDFYSCRMSKICFLHSAFRPGKSPDRGGRQMENYEPISPPQGYQGTDKQEAGGPPSQRRDTDNSEIRYAVGTFYVRYY